MPSTDITYCARECGNMECKRNWWIHRDRILEIGEEVYVSQAQFIHCKEWREKKDERL